MTKTLESIHRDMCRPMPVASIRGKKYVLLLIDNYSKYTHVFLLRKKSLTTQVIQDFIEYMKTQLGKKPQIIRSDRGGEYVNNNLREYLTKQGIRMQYTATSTPEQNGVAERKKSDSN